MEWYRQLMDNAPEDSKRAVVHIGINKTGSTAIQDALFSVRTRLLSEARILYPSIAANQSIHLWTMFREEPHPVLQRIEPDAVDEASVAHVRKRFFAALEEDFTNPDWDTLVISAEDLSRFYAPDVSRFIKWLIEHVDDIRVVAYVRHPVDWTRSMVQEQLKQGETLGQVHENVPRPEWQLRFAPWLNAVGFERFHLVCFDEAREATDGIMASFCNAADLPYEKVLSLAPTTSANESMSHEAVLLVDSLNRQRPLYRDGKLSPERRWFGIDAMMTVPGNKFSLTPEQEEQARIVSRPDLRWLNSRFGTDLYPDIFEDGPSKETVHVETMPQETVDTLAINLSNLGNELERQKLRGDGAGEGNVEKTLQETGEQLKNTKRRADDHSTELYLDLMKRCVSGWIYASPELRANENFITRPMGALGKDIPDAMHSMLGSKRLDNVRFCVESVIEENIPGDLIETGVWRGGGTIFMRAILEAYGVTDRTVWVADSFEGLPPPNTEKYPQDAGDIHHTIPKLAVSLEEVKAHFEGYGLLDDQVRFLKGWFKDTLPAAPIEELAVLRLDGDMYESTMDALTHLYPKLSVGGYLIVDDYGAVEGCKKAVHDYRQNYGVEEEMIPIDWSGAYWRKSHRGTEDRFLAQP